MALTYLSIFAVVPALVVVFSVVQAVTGMERIAAQLNAVILDNLAVGARTSLEPYLARFTSNAHAASAGLVGGRAAGLVGGVALLQRRAGHQRPVGHPPPPLAGAPGRHLLGRAHARAAAAGRLDWRSAWALAPGWPGPGSGGWPRSAAWLLTCAFFAGLYWLVPYTRVRAGGRRERGAGGRPGLGGGQVGLRRGGPPLPPLPRHLRLGGGAAHLPALALRLLGHPARRRPHRLRGAVRAGALARRTACRTTRPRARRWPARCSCWWRWPTGGRAAWPRTRGRWPVHSA